MILVDGQRSVGALRGLAGDAGIADALGELAAAGFIAPRGDAACPAEAVGRAAHPGPAPVARANPGPTPSKALRETAPYFSGLDQRGLYGIDYPVRENLTVPEFWRREVEVTNSLRALGGLNLSRHAIAVYRGA